MGIVVVDPVTVQEVQGISDVQKTDLNADNASQTTSINGNVDSAETAILNALTAKATGGDVTAARDSVNANVDACESAVLSAISFAASPAVSSYSISSSLYGGTYTYTLTINGTGLQNITSFGVVGMQKATTPTGSGSATVSWPLPRVSAALSGSATTRSGQVAVTTITGEPPAVIFTAGGFCFV